MENPLKQYFRRPALFIKLPSGGKYYTPGSLIINDNSEVPVYPMTAIDEITAKTPDSLFNGSAVVEIIKSCVPDIKDPWSIPAVDLDSILVGIRVATNGNDLDIETVCPACQEISKYGANLIQLLSTINPKGYEGTFSLGDLTFKFKPLSFRQINQSSMFQFDLQREIEEIEKIVDLAQRNQKNNNIVKKITAMNIALVSDTIESISTPTTVVTDSNFIQEYLNGCDKNTFESIRKHVVSIREDVNIKPLKIKCVECNHEYEQPIALNVTDFFE